MLSGYKEISYIESSGSQYIDTGIIMTERHNVEITIAPIGSYSGWAWVCGAQAANVQQSYGIGVYQWQTTTFQRGTNVFHDKAYSFAQGEKYTFRTDGNVLYINDVVQSTLSTVSTLTTPTTLHLFGVKATDGVREMLPCRLYSAKIWDGDILIADYVPCVSDDGVYGLYDTVSNTFNSGTGGFSQGWRIIDGVLTNTNAPPLPEAYMTKPYPSALWRIDSTANNGFPYHELMIDVEKKGPGAFCYAENLTRVSIPESVKKIGVEAFRHTALRKVRLAADCEYYPTSFPEGCEITFYGGGGEYGQLYDSDGYAIIDSDGYAVYVKE